MPTDPGTVHLSETPSRGGRQFKAPPDPIFGEQQPDGSFGNLAHYKILKQLGCGGMGAVYLAQDEGLQRRVALKVMLPSAAADPMAKERFLREARASAAVKHDNVVTIYQVGEDRGIPFIAMEYLAGAPLDQFLARKGRLSVEQTLRVGMEAADGLAAAHTLGLIHRDIKPANIWLEAPKGRIKILDFGIARRVTEQPGVGLTGAGTVVGTPGYMSPEQARGKQLDARSDLFSLGIVLYQLTTGQVPFDGDTVLAVLTALAVDEPIPVRMLAPQTPVQLESLIHRMLAKRPDDRPHSALTVVEELRTIAKGPEVPYATAVEQQVPQVIYVPIAVTVQESFNPSEFDGLGENSTSSQTEFVTPEPATGRGRGLWIAVGGVLLLAVIAVAGISFAMRKPTPEPAPVPTPPAPKNTNKNQPPVITDPPKKGEPASGAGRGIRFAADQMIPIPRLPIPDNSPYTLEGFITIDESFDASSLVFGTKYRFWVVLVQTNQGLQWQGYAAVIGPGGMRVETALVGPMATKGKRTHVALVRTATDLRFFVDGKLYDTKPFSGLYSGGGLVSMGGEKFAGVIDEFRASRAAQYTKNFTPNRLEKDKDTDALYWFEEGQGTSLKDQSGNGYDCQLNWTKWVTVPKEPLPRPLTDGETRLLNRHLLGHLTNQPVTEQEIHSLEQLRTGVLHLRPEGGPPLDDTAFERLSRLPLAPGLAELQMRASNLTNAGFAHITRFPNIDVLTITDSQITDDGLKPLASLKKLTRFSLYGSKITDTAATSLGEAKNLIWLDLGKTPFGNDGLKGLAPLTSLQELKLEGTAVTDAGLEHLRSRKQLKIVHLKGASVTADGVKQLEAAIPGIRVFSDIKP